MCCSVQMGFGCTCNSGEPQESMTTRHAGFCTNTVTTFSFESHVASMKPSFHLSAQHSVSKSVPRLNARMNTLTNTKQAFSSPTCVTSQIFQPNNCCPHAGVWCGWLSGLGQVEIWLPFLFWQPLWSKYTQWGACFGPLTCNLTFGNKNGFCQLFWQNKCCPTIENLLAPKIDLQSVLIWSFSRNKATVGKRCWTGQATICEAVQLQSPAQVWGRYYPLLLAGTHVLGREPKTHALL